jgi:FdrA protein
VSVNVVRPGPVGIVAASETVAQQLICLLDAVGVGISFCHGVGTADGVIGGRSALEALALLDADPATELIAIVSAAHIAPELSALAASMSTPVGFVLLGPGREDLTAAAQGIVQALGRVWREPRSWLSAVPIEPGDPDVPGSGFSVLRGAFAGGGLCYEAMLIASAELGPIASNIPLGGAPRLGPELEPAEGAHGMIDFSDHELIRGRPHPIVDCSIRADWILQQALTPHVEGTVLLLDVILGEGAHPDPAGELAPAIAAAHVVGLAFGTALAVVVSLCGTGGDPQGLQSQAAALSAAGAAVHRSNATAARAAVRLITVGS